MLSENQIKEYIKNLEKGILNEGKKSVELTRQWLKSIPDTPGCYVVYEHGIIVYAGETDNLRRRLGNMRYTTNHILRRNIGKAKFSEVPDYRPATSKKKFPAHIEQMLNEYIQKEITIAVKPIKFGRKELEEMIISKHPCKYNKRGKKKIVRQKGNLRLTMANDTRFLRYPI